MDHLGPLLVRNIRQAGRELGLRSWHDPEKLTDDIWAGYQLPLRADNWDRALWFFTRSSSASDGLEEVIAGLKVPVFVVTGDDDRVVPTADSIRLAEDTTAELEVFEACGHIAHEECPEQFLAMMARFRLNLPAAAGSD
jgi:pimeloyl-ACP methyl ester carboxylesterase